MNEVLRSTIKRSMLSCPLARLLFIAELIGRLSLTESFNFLPRLQKAPTVSEFRILSYNMCSSTVLVYWIKIKNWGVITGRDEVAPKIWPLLCFTDDNALPMRHLWKVLHPKTWTEEAHQNSHRRTSLQVPYLQQRLHAVFFLQNSPPDSYRYV